MQIQKTFRDFELTSQISGGLITREQRLIFANAGADASGESGEKEISLIWSEYKNNEEFAKNLDEAIKQGKIDEQRKKELLANGQAERRRTEDSEKKMTGTEKVLTKIEDLKKKKKKQQKIAESAVESFQSGYLDSVKELRESVRAQIEEELGIEFKEDDEKVAEEFIALEQMIWQRVESVLDEKGYTEELKTIESDKKRAKRCYESLGTFFRDEKKKELLRFLKKRNIPAGEKTNIEKLLDFSDKYESGKEWDKNTMMIGIVRTGELRNLELALNTVEKIFEKWNSAEDVEKQEKLDKDLAEYEKRLTSMNGKVKISSKQKRFEELIENNSDTRWDDLFARREADLEGLKKLLTEDGSKPNLRLIRACLDGNNEEIKTLEETLESLEKIKEDEEIKPETAKAALPTGKEVEEGGKDGEIIHAAHDEHGPTVFDKIGKNLQQFFTANGKITWYSLHDIAGAFKLIKESWEKHTHSISEDKRGPLAEGMLFWRPEISRRVELQDQLSEKSRANELRDHYKNKKHAELLAELSWSAPKDRRRIILEVIADRGNLRMSDKELIGIICRGTFREKDWEKADSVANYTRMREAFKEKIDAPHSGFIGEIGYADELFNKQSAGSETASATGKKLSGSSETISIDAELGIFNLQRQKTYHGGSEGEAELVGMIETMVGRGNAFSNNGSFNTIKIKTEKGEKEVTENSNQGLVGLMMVDAYLRGNMSRDQIGEIGKKHESGFNPYSCTSDVIANRKTDHPTIAGKKISKFEEWGWIIETTEGGRGFITDLGKSEIIKFFNTRNARAKMADGTEKIIHIAIDSNTYKAHSSRHRTMNDTRNQTIKVGDKLMSYLVKKSSIGLFESATKLDEHAGYAILTEMRDLTSLIKAGVEDFIDGADMMKENDRFYEKFTGKGLVKNENGEWVSDDKDRRVISEDQRESYGKERMQRGRNILVKMLHNLWQYREDREVTQIHAQYNFYERNPKTGLPKKGTSQECNLKDFIEKSLGQWKDTHKKEYDEIMREVNLLFDENEKLTSTEAVEAYHLGGVKNRTDFDERQRKQKRKTETTTT